MKTDVVTHHGPVDRPVEVDGGHRAWVDVSGAVVHRDQRPHHVEHCVVPFIGHSRVDKPTIR